MSSIRLFDTFSIVQRLRLGMRHVCSLSASSVTTVTNNNYQNNNQKLCCKSVICACNHHRNYNTVTTNSINTSTLNKIIKINNNSYNKVIKVNSLFDLQRVFSTTTTASHFLDPRAALPGLVAPRIKPSKKKLREQGLLPPLPKIYHTELKHLRGSWMRMNFLAKQIQRLTVKEALRQMEFSPRRLAVHVTRLLNNVERKARMNGNTAPLYVKRCYVGKSTYKKKLYCSARGKAGIKHTTWCHVFIDVQDMPIEAKNRDYIVKMLRKQRLLTRPRPVHSGLL